MPPPASWNTRSLAAPDDVVATVHVAANGSLVALGAGNAKWGVEPRLFVQDRAGLPLWKGGEELVLRDAALAADGTLLVGAFDGRGVETFGRDGERRWTAALTPPLPIGGHSPVLAVSADGQRVAVACLEAGIRLFDSGGSVLWDRALPRRADALVMAADGSRIAAAAGDVLIFDADGGPVAFQSEGGPFQRIAMSGDGSRILAWSDRKGGCVLLDPDGRPVWTGDMDRKIRRCEFSADGGIMACIDAGYALRVHDRQGALLWSFGEGWGSPSLDVAVADGGGVVAAGGEEKVTLFSPTGSELLSEAVDGAAGALGCSADGSLVIAGTTTGRLLILDSRPTGFA